MTKWTWVVAFLALTPQDAAAAPDQLLVRRAAEAVRVAYHCPQYRTAAVLKQALRERNIELVSPLFAPTWHESVLRMEDLFETANSDEKPQLCETFWTLYGDVGSVERGWLELRP